MALYYVDFENVQLKGLRGIEELRRGEQVYIFCRESDVVKIKDFLAVLNCKASVKCKIVNCVSKNALDFELITELFICRNKSMRVIISKDKGFDAAVQRGLRNGILCLRKEYINQTGLFDFWKYFGIHCREINLI